MRILPIRMDFLEWACTVYSDVVNFYQLRISNPDAFTGDMDRVYLFGIPAAF